MCQIFLGKEIQPFFPIDDFDASSYSYTSEGCSTVWDDITNLVELTLEYDSHPLFKVGNP